MHLPEHDPIKRDDIDTARGDHSSGWEAALTTGALSMIGHTPLPVRTDDGIPGRQYLAPMTASARAAADALRCRITGLDDTRLHNLLYLAQGLHLTELDEALFAEPIYAVPSGAEIDGLSEPATAALTGEHLNTIAEITARYGRLTAAELRTLVWAGDPWKLAAARPEDPRIEWAWMRDWFTRASASSGAPRLNASQLRTLAARAAEHPSGDDLGVPLTREAIQSRIDTARGQATGG